MSLKPIAIDLYCGLGGWAEGLIAEGWRVIGYDIERHDYGKGSYPGALVLQDVLTIHGSQFKDASLIVASPPCQEYSYIPMNLEPLHTEYCRLSGHEIRWDTGRRFAWEHFIYKGFVLADLAIVIKYLKDKIRMGKRTEACLRFRSLIEDTDGFEEHLSEARKVLRIHAKEQIQKMDAAKVEILQSTGRPPTSERPAKAVGDIAAGLKAREDFVRLGREL